MFMSPLIGFFTPTDTGLYMTTSVEGTKTGTYTDKGLGTEEEALPRPLKLLDKRV